MNNIRNLLKEKYNFSELQILNHKNYLNKKILADIKKLRQGYPLDYLIGHKNFINIKIDLSKKPLIPRPETEYWVEKEIKNIPEIKKINILDIYSGSGCIGIAILKNCPNTHVTFADISQKSIKQIKINLKINNIEKGYKILKSNRFKNINGNFDYIFANPPYVYKKSAKLRFEPAKALYAKEKGLREIRLFLKDAKNYLKKDRIIFMEFGYGQKAAIEKLLKAYHYSNWSFKKDQYNRYRWLQTSL